MSATTTGTTEHLTRAELDALPLVVPLWPTAARAFGVGRSTAYSLAARGEFPVPVLRVGNQFRVSTAALRECLGASA